MKVNDLSPAERIRHECLDRADRTEYLLAQLDSVLADLSPYAAKTGALGTCEIIEAIARRAAHFSFPLVVDPVMISKHGALLLPEEAQKTLVRELLPHAALVTPNLYEASVLSGRQIKDPSLRTPLAAILGYAELIQEDFYGPQPEKSMDALTRIRSNGKHLLGLLPSRAGGGQPSRGSHVRGTCRRRVPTDALHRGMKDTQCANGL
jgi:hypothetical protein